MKKNVKRILSFVLMAVMVFALLPVFGKPMVVKADDVQEHDHSNWVEISTSKQLKKLGIDGGNGYLVNDIEISETIMIMSSQPVNLCLNGKSIILTADEDTIFINGTLNLYDESKEPGKITHNNAKGRGVFNRGTFTMNGGTISGNNFTVCGGVYNYGTFTMNGGTISGNNANDGGGVYNYGTFTMTGGTISGNNATHKGGGVFNDGTFTMNGGIILGNKADNGGGVYNHNGTFTMKKGTVSENEVKEYGGGVYNHNKGTFTMEGGTISGNDANLYGGGVFNYGTFTNNGGTISGNDANLYGGGVANNSGNFTMNGGTISGNDANYYGGGVYNNNGIFTMNGGTITGNTSDYSGGGVSNYKYGTFTMNEGTITGNTSKNEGGGVENIGTFTLKGGTISENKEVKSGGGVYNNGNFTMNGGTISGNNADQHGGGVYNVGTFTMEGGTISENKEVKYGGGVYNVGTFTMEGGTISYNDVVSRGGRGGGVDNYYGTFTMEGGTIESNKAILGGGVDNYGTFTMKKGTIKENKAHEGTGVFFYDSFTKEGGDIDGSIEGGNGTACTVTFKACNYTNDSIIQYVNPNKDTNLAPNKFSKEGVKFGCWRDESGNKTYEDNATIKINNNLILNALWIESAKVKFVVNNGSWSDGSTVKDVECWKYDYEDKVITLRAEDIPKPENPNTGYKAGGWDAEPDTEKTLKQDETYTYTYTFAPIDYTIKYDSNGGTGAMNNQSRKYDDKAALTANAFTYEGKTFDCWNTAADGSGTPYRDEEVGNLSITDNDTVTLYAQWTIGTFTISWKNYDGTVLETDKNVAYGSTPAYDGETPVRAKEGNKVYTFSGWTPEIDTVKGAATYTATYSVETIVEPTEPSIQDPDSTDPVEPTTPEPEEPEEEIPAKDWLDDLRLALRIADELGGPQTVEYSGDFALSYDIMEYLKEHTDITLVYHVTYEGVTYTVTIPAGRAIADANIGWYGPLWLLANYGGDNVPEIIAGSGKYTVVAGDTLSAIAEKFGTTVDYLAQKNGIKNPDYIIVGQVIVY